MNKITLLSILFVINCTTTSHAYEFSFFNNTNTPVAIAIQYTGNDNIPEPLYKQLAKPKEMITFTPGKLKIPDIKWGFCLDTISYVQNPTTEQKVHNFEKAPWRKVPITWVEEKSATKKKGKTPRKQKESVNVANPAAPAPVSPAPSAAQAASTQKSLCRDRHFDIAADEHDKISITSSLNE